MLGQTLGLEISGRTKHGTWTISSSFAYRFGAKKPHPSRSIWMSGWRTAKRGWDVMLQMYRPGMTLDWHTDGDGVHNTVYSVVLWQPKVGGVLEVDGPHTRWWRFCRFDGGTTRHRVTPCGGYRVVLMIQHMQTMTAQERMDRRKHHNGSDC